MAEKKTISILGAGSMGTAIAYLISKQGKGEVRLWGRDSQLISQIQQTRENAKYLPGIKLSEDVFLTSDLKEAIEGSDLVILAVPSFAVREMAERLSEFRGNLPPILMISKGMEQKTSLLPFQIIEEVLRTEDILHLTGVGYAKEIARELPVTEVLAARSRALLRDFKNLFQTRNIRIETSDDLLGVQLGGALKNVMVIGIGMADCLERSSEIKEGLIMAGVEEMIKLGNKMGAREETFWGSAGKGDLILSSDPLSRNYRLGIALYQRGIREVERELSEKKMVVEGFHTAWAAYQLAIKYGVRLPIVEEVYKVIYERMDPKLSARELIRLSKTNYLRSKKKEERGEEMTNRVGHITRKTKEVDIEIEIRLDEPGNYEVSITADKEEPNFGLPALALFEHLFAQIYHHGRIGGKVRGHGDLPHHIVEDIGICWGQALKDGLGNRKGIERFESLSVPFEGSLATVSIDLSGRGYAVLDFQDMDNKTLAGMAQHLFEGIALNAGFNIYGKVETVGTLRNDHHKLEAFCKAFGRSLHRSTRITGPDVIPSTNGVL